MTDPGESEPMAPSRNDTALPMGRRVLLFGLLGTLLALLPATLLLSTTLVPCRPWIVIVPVFWASVVGAPFTYWWSHSLHERVDQLKPAAQEPEDDNRALPRRVPWIPAWIGVYERGVYCLLLAADIPGGATFIGAWVVLKLAGGWQIWSKGTTYGRAIFFAGLLGNLMSILFSLVASLVIRVGVGVHGTSP